jgi:hypothetical protein
MQGGSNSVADDAGKNQFLKLFGYNIYFKIGEILKLKDRKPFVP